MSNPWMPPGYDVDKIVAEHDAVAGRHDPQLDELEGIALAQSVRLREDAANGYDNSYSHPYENVHQLRDEVEQAVQQSSWSPVDFTAVLDGSWQPPQPTVGRRTDGVGLFYPGKMHSVVSETEGGKTWFALAACLDEMHAGNNVLYLDFEDDEGGIVGRLITMGATGSLLTAHFTYLRPEQPIDAHVDELTALLIGRNPSLCVIDGVTEAMVLHGLSPLDNFDVAKFSKLLAKRLRVTGAAVAALDHVTKDREGRGRYALGAVHKLNGLDGAQYLLDNRHPFGVGLRGVSTIKIAKDRPAQLRKHGQPGSHGLFWFGDLVVDSRQPIIETMIEPPRERSDDFRPTVLMQRISEALAKHGDMSQRKIRDVVTGQASAISSALTYLVLDGYVSEGDSKTPHKLLRPYAPPSDES